MLTEHIPYSDHESSFEHLAKEFLVPINELTQLYKNELNKSEVGARITIFLSIFALCKVKEMLRIRNSEKQ